jgi:hypothetical protein
MSLSPPRSAVTDWALPSQGITLDGWLRPRATSHEGDAIGPDDIQLLANWRFTHARVPVDAALVTAPGGLARIVGALDLLKRFGLDTVLALHLDVRTHDAIWIDHAASTAVGERWATVASAVRDHPGCLALELLDAPDPPDTLTADDIAALGGVRLSPAAARRATVPGAIAGRAWGGLASRLTETIRDTGAMQAIVVDAPRGAPEALDHLRPVPDDGVAYGIRAFAPEAFTMQGLAPERDAPADAHGAPDRPIAYPGTIDGERWDRTRLEAWLAPARRFREAYRAPLYVTAVGASAGAPRGAHLTWLRTVLRLAHECHAGWAYAAYHDARFGIVCTRGPFAGLDRFRNGYRLDYDLLGVIQAEA